jgi:RHS repeat-associated protein
VRQTTFNSSNNALTDILAAGTPQQEPTTYNRDSSTNLVMSMTDALNRTTAYAYDNLGNLLSLTQLYGTPDAVTTSYSYDPIFSQIASITDPLNHITSFAYDAFGNPITLTDPLNHQWTFTYNVQGEQLSAADPLKNTTTYNYIGGDLISITDPLLRTTTLARDGAGRLVRFTDALGETTQYQYDPLDDLTNITDTLGNVTSFVYDADRDMVTLTDALTHSTAFTYDGLDRLSTRADPLHNTETYTYDLAGNLLTFTDRKGQKTSFAYDPLNRETQATYADASFTAYTYDLGNRLLQASDSVGGTIARAYDGLDRRTSEISRQGSVSYAYDNASRRTRMTVAGQASTSYTYDNANRPTKITHGGSAVTLMYDSANRRKSSLLANGIMTSYGYDKASELTGLTYGLGVTTVGNLTYAYDAAGRRSSIGGSYARTGLPQAVASASYNADDQLLQWGSSSLTYDLDGNLTNDGVNAYAWNARNQLASINLGATASFLYDGFGRREAKAIGATNTSFLYDGINPVQELSGTIVTANLLTGLAVDERFSRADAAGPRYCLSDALGNTLGLTDSTGALQTQYTYEPYGNTTITGTSSSNRYQYTGRENDTTGLYYYRARFYNAATGRFISEDPIGFGGGVNLYAYVRNNPLRAVDPFGLTDILTGPLQPPLDTQTPPSVPSGCRVAANFVQCMVTKELKGKPLSLAADAAVGMCPLAETPITATVCIAGFLYKTTEIPQTLIEAGQCYQEAQSQCAGCAFMQNFKWEIAAVMASGTRALCVFTDWRSRCRMISRELYLLRSPR